MVNRNKFCSRAVLDENCIVLNREACVNGDNATFVSVVAVSTVECVCKADVEVGILALNAGRAGNVESAKRGNLLDCVGGKRADRTCVHLQRALTLHGDSSGVACYDFAVLCRGGVGNGNGTAGNLDAVGLHSLAVQVKGVGAADFAAVVGEGLAELNGAARVQASNACCVGQRADNVGSRSGRNGCDCSAAGKGSAVRGVYPSVEVGNSVIGGDVVVHCDCVSRLEVGGVNNVGFGLADSVGNVCVIVQAVDNLAGSHIADDAAQSLVADELACVAGVHHATAHDIAGDAADVVGSGGRANCAVVGAVENVAGIHAANDTACALIAGNNIAVVLAVVDDGGSARCPVNKAYDSTDVGRACDVAVGNGYVLNGSIKNMAEQTDVRGGAVDVKAVYGVALAVKGAGEGICLGTDGSESDRVAVLAPLAVGFERAFIPGDVGGQHEGDACGCFAGIGVVGQKLQFSGRADGDRGACRRGFGGGGGHGDGCSRGCRGREAEGSDQADDHAQCQKTSEKSFFHQVILPK